MKALIFTLGVLAATVATATGAAAQNYPWCAYYGNGDRGTNCGFSTYAQCMADVSGIGGFCQQNNMYRPPAGPHHRRVRTPS